MDREIISEVVLIDKPEDITTQGIEDILVLMYGEIIRWSIIGVEGNQLKIAVTYEKTEA